MDGARVIFERKGGQRKEGVGDNITSAPGPEASTMHTEDEQSLLLGGDTAADQGFSDTTSSYQLEDGESLVADDADIGIPYIEPALYSDDDLGLDLPIDAPLSAVDELLGPLPDLTEEEGPTPELASSVSDGGETNDFNTAAILVSESFRLPGTNFIVTKGDRIRLVKEGDRFRSSKNPQFLEGENVDDILKELSADLNPIPVQAVSDGILDGVVLDEDDRCAYCEAQVSFRIPISSQKLVLEQGDRFVIKMKRYVEMEAEPDDSTKGQEAAAAQIDIGIEADDKAAAAAFTQGTPGFNQASGPGPNIAEAAEKEDDDKEKGKEDKDKKDSPKGDDDKPKEGDDDKDKEKKEAAAAAATRLQEDQGLVGRRTSRRLKFSLRQQPDPVSWN